MSLVMMLDTLGFNANVFCYYILYRYRWEEKKIVYLQLDLEGILLQPTMWQLNRLSMCIFNHMTFLISYVNF